jgi:dTDP-4-dehydrorhamnose reductase
MRLLVTGAAGMLGTDVVACASAHDVVALRRGELDITDADAVAAAVRDARPEAVINCAAWTDVDGAEAAEEQATAINGDGAGRVAAAAAAGGAFTVHVSTDYVFAGDAQRPYVETDEPAPRTAYGRSKLAGERAVAQSGARHAICRTAWLYGAGGKNFVDTMLALAQDRDEVSVVTDQVGSPTWAGHLSPALLDLAAAEAVGVFHTAGGGQCSWHELTVELYRAAGVDCRVNATTAAEFQRPAPRPSWSVLASERDETPRLAPWQEGVRGYLSERNAS